MRDIAQCKMPDSYIDFEQLIKHKLITKEMATWIKKGKQYGFKINFSYFPVMNDRYGVNKLSINLDYSRTVT